MNLVKKTAVTLIAIAVLFIVYNSMLLQNEEYPDVYTYYIFATLFLGAGVVLLYKTLLGVKMFTFLTWATTVYAGYIVLSLAFKLAASFLLLSLLFNVQAQLSLVAQLIFIVGLVLYMHSTRRALANLRFTKGSSVDARIVLDANMPKKARVGLILASIGLIVVGLFSVQAVAKVFTYKTDPSGGNSQKVEQYLEDKYGEKFKLTNFETSKQWHSSFESWQKIKADAQPVNNPDITFEVSGCIEKCKDNQTFSDKYVYEYWAYGQRPAIEAKLKEVYGTVPEYKIQMGLSLGGKRTLPKKSLVEFKEIQADNAYKPFISLTTYQNGTFTKDNIAESERRTRAMTTFMPSLDMTDFTFAYTMKNTAPPSVSEYRATGVERSDIHCSESLSIDEKEYSDMQSAGNLKKFYHKSCGYKTPSQSGGGVVRGAYPE